MDLKARILLVVCFLLCTQALAKEVRLSLDDVELFALRENKDIKLKIEDVRKAQEKVKEAQGGLFPSVSISGAASESIGLISKDAVTYTGQLTLKQYLYRGGKTLHTILYNQQGVSIQEALLDREKLDILFKVRKAFYTLVLAEKYAQLNKRILENTVNHFRVAEIRFQNGQASGQELERMRASKATMNQVYTHSLRQVEINNSLLVNLLGFDGTIQIKPEGEIVYTAENISYDQALMQALRKRPEIRQYEAQEKASQHSVRIARAENLPSVYASWDYYLRSRPAASSVKNTSDSQIVGVTISWPIFDGWATRAKINQAMIDIKEAQILRQKAVLDTALDLKAAYIAFQDALARMEATRAEIMYYEQNLKSAHAQSVRGILSELDLNDALVKYETAFFNNTSAIYDYMIAKAKIEQAIGEIDAKL